MDRRSTRVSRQIKQHLISANPIPSEKTTIEENFIPRKGQWMEVSTEKTNPTLYQIVEVLPIQSNSKQEKKVKVMYNLKEKKSDISFTSDGQFYIDKYPEFKIQPLKSEIEVSDHIGIFDDHELIIFDFDNTLTILGSCRTDMPLLSPKDLDDFQILVKYFGKENLPTFQTLIEILSKKGKKIGIASYGNREVIVKMLNQILGYEYFNFSNVLTPNSLNHRQWKDCHFPKPYFGVNKNDLVNLLVKNTFGSKFDRSKILLVDDSSTNIERILNLGYSGISVPRDLGINKLLTYLKSINSSKRTKREIQISKHPIGEDKGEGKNEGKNEVEIGTDPRSQFPVEISSSIQSKFILSSPELVRKNQMLKIPVKGGRRNIRPPSRIESRRVPVAINSEDRSSMSENFLTWKPSTSQLEILDLLKNQKLDSLKSIYNKKWEIPLRLNLAIEAIRSENLDIVDWLSFSDPEILQLAIRNFIFRSDSEALEKALSYGIIPSQENINLVYTVPNPKIESILMVSGLIPDSKTIKNM